MGKQAKASGAGNKGDKVSEICLALPAAERSVGHDHVTYRVRGKVFAYFLDDHHGDGIVSVCVKAELGENKDRVRRDPEHYYLPDYIGPRGWFGLRLDHGRVDWREVASIVERSYRLTAPKTLLKQLDAARA
ncbi:MAG TPA: MmcQ/YjbR family DNA-binding protein [Gammaproteobacteria bacterium]|nr:MmcQ/YjbR family DNA-binding protein [Gammaproteobacteria bacterium]